MGHKVNPKGFRIGTIYTWSSIWFSAKDYKTFLKQDIQIRKFIKNELKDASVEKVLIERSSGDVVIYIYSGKPGIVIGRSGAGVEELKKKIQKQFLPNAHSISLNIKEVDRPSLSATLVMQGVVADLEKRIPFRRAVKQAISKVERAGALGVKITVSGRLNGSEIARSETLSVGKIPLHTIRANIDYTPGVARTMYGAIGVKVWIYKGDVFKK